MQQVGSQQTLSLSGFRARTNALINLSCTCGAMSSASTPAALRNSPHRLRCRCVSLRYLRLQIQPSLASADNRDPRERRPHNLPTTPYSCGLLQALRRARRHPRRRTADQVCFTGLIPGQAKTGRLRHKGRSLPLDCYGRGTAGLGGEACMESSSAATL